MPANFSSGKYEHEGAVIMANYLQYIASMQQGKPKPHKINVLVSGQDINVKTIVGNNIVSSAYDRGKTLLIIDNTQRDSPLKSIGRYSVVNALDGNVKLCDAFDTSAFTNIIRLRTLLSDLGFEQKEIMKIASYLQFVKETERRLDAPSTTPTIETLQQYGSEMLVNAKLTRLRDSGKISPMNYDYLQGYYSEISASAADFDHFLDLFVPFVSGDKPAPNTALLFPFGELSQDKAVQKLITRLLISYVKNNIEAASVLILDDVRGGKREFIPELVTNLPTTVEINMLSDDAFTFEEPAALINTFPVRIYTRHDSMASCTAISKQCGEISITKTSTATTIDKRWSANSAWDILFNNNRTETMTVGAPTDEARFKPDFINRLCPGTGIIDYAGNKVLFNF